MKTKNAFGTREEIVAWLQRFKDMNEWEDRQPIPHHSAERQISTSGELLEFCVKLGGTFDNPEADRAKIAGILRMKQILSACPRR